MGNGDRFHLDILGFPVMLEKYMGLPPLLSRKKLTLPSNLLGQKIPDTTSSNIFVYVPDGTSYVISSTQPSGHEDKNLNSGLLWTLALDLKQIDDCES